jgi:ribosomal protein S4
MTLYKKPRLKVPAQTHNKVYLNKNSKFRAFYKQRGKLYKVRIGPYRCLLVIRNMKWTIARRYFGSRRRIINRLRFKYSNELHSKQQLKQFYGNLHDKQLIKFLRLAWHTRLQHSNTLCLKNLEARLDILLLRMRLLPTIFFCNQLIRHQGIYVNNEKIFIPHYIIRISDTISFSKSMWLLLNIQFIKKITNRYNGNFLNIKIKNKRLRNQLQKAKKSTRLKKRNNLKIIIHITNSIVDFFMLSKICHKKLNIFAKKNNNNKIIKILSITIIKKLWLVFKKLNKLKKQLNKIYLILRKWRKNYYFKGEILIIYIYIYIKYIVYKLKLFINQLTIYKKLILEYYSLPFKINNILLNFSIVPNYYNPIKITDDLKASIRLFQNKYYELIQKSNSIHKIGFDYKVSNEMLFYQIFKGLSFNIKKGLVNALFFKKFNKMKQYTISNNRNTTTYWYIPHNLEIDYTTLRLSLIRGPEINNILYPFYYSIYKLVYFYSNYGYK